MGCGASTNQVVVEGGPVNSSAVPTTLPQKASPSTKPPAGPTLKVESDGDLFRGLSVSFLNGKLLELLHLNSESTECVYHVEPRIRELSADPLICPRDGRPGCALVDTAPDRFAGRADVMISYGWGYRMLDIVTALASYCQRRNAFPKDVRVWACFYCINQHRVKESQSKGICVPFKEFEETFAARVKGIGKVLCLIAPWNNPLYVKRVWCVFELYTAITRPGVEFELILPPNEAADFEQTLATDQGLTKIWDCLSALNVEDAQASVEHDRQTILNLVKTGPGADYVNNMVQSHLRTWFADMSVTRLKLKLGNVLADEAEAKSVIATAVSACRFWSLQGASMDDAVVFAEEIEKFCIGTMGEDSPEYAATAGLKAWLAMLGSHYDKAIEAYEQILQIQEKLSGKETKEYGATMYDLGWAWCSKGYFQEAVQVLGKAKAIQAQVNGIADPAYGVTVRDMGEAMIELQEFDSAFEAFEEAVSVLSAAYGRHHPQTCIALKHQARVFTAKGDPKRAVLQLGEVLDFEQSTVGAESADHAVTLLILTEALRAMGRLGRALYICDECLRTFEHTLGRSTKFSLWTMWSRARILRDMGLDDRCELDLQEALTIAEAIAGKSSVRYIRLHKELEELRSESESMPMKSLRTDTDPWGEGGEVETALLAKFRSLDHAHDGLVEFAEIMKLVKKLIGRDLEEQEVEALVAEMKLSKDLVHNRRLSFRQFVHLGEDSAKEQLSYIHTAVKKYYEQLISEYTTQAKDTSFSI